MFLFLEMCTWMEHGPSWVFFSGFNALFPSSKGIWTSYEMLLAYIYMGMGKTNYVYYHRGNNHPWIYHLFYGTIQVWGVDTYIYIHRSILDGYFNPLVFWYQWDYLRSPAKKLSFFAGYLRLAMIWKYKLTWPSTNTISWFVYEPYFASLMVYSTTTPHLP